MPKESEIIYHVDLVKPSIISLTIQGWVIEKQNKEQIFVEDESGERIFAHINRFVREDANQTHQMEPGYQSGFHVVMEMRNINTRKLYLVFQNDSCVKKYKIDLKKNYFKQHWQRRYMGKVMPPDSYDEWVRMQEPTKKELLTQRRKRFEGEPLFSIVIPLYNTPICFLKDIIDSVVQQSYSGWELCLADGSSSDEPEAFIRQQYAKEKRIKYKRLKENKGISANTNEGLAMARGDFIVFADHDDTLAKHALYEMALEYHRKPQIEVIYSDEDKINQSGEYYFEPHLKPDFDMDLLECNNYICHLFAVKKELLEKVGKLNPEYDGAQDYDLVLRCCERARLIVHIPKVLYHWRVHPDSTAGDPDSKSYAFTAGAKALQAHFKRCDIQARVEMTKLPGRYLVKRKILGNPRVSILIPNKDQLKLLKKCVASILEKTGYENYEILIIENNSTQAETFDWYQRIQKTEHRIRVISWPDAFNYAAIHNYAVKEAKGEYLLFLNNDIEVLTAGWIEEMLSNSQREEVGAVGAKLYYPDQTIQHGGVILGFGGVAGHIMAGSTGEQESVYMPALLSVRQTSAVTAACMMTKKSLYQQVGGMDAEFAVAYNDIDYCLKLRALGKYVVYTPYAELIHYESKTRGLEDSPQKKQRWMAEGRRFAAKWSAILAQGDPYFNQNLFQIIPEYREMKYDDTYWVRYNDSK